MDRILNNAFKQNLVGSYASGATSIQLASISNTVGNADYLPDPTGGAYNLIFYSTVYGDPASARNNSAYMIGRVTAIDYGTNTLTITTAQENTADVAMDSAWACLYGATSKMFEDIRTGKQNILSEGAFVDGDKTKLDGIESGAKDNQSATEVPFTPDGDIAASNVQAAITEVRDDTDTKLGAKANLSGGNTFSGVQDFGGRIDANSGISFDGGTNVLDNFEVGSWTPTLIAGGTDFDSVTYNSSVVSGGYIRIGSVCVLFFRVQSQSITKGSASGNIFVGGVPFTPRSRDTFSPSYGLTNGSITGWTNQPSGGSMFNEDGAKIGLRKNNNNDRLVVADVSTSINNIGGTLIFEIA